MYERHDCLSVESNGCHVFTEYFCVLEWKVGSKVYPKLKEVDDVLGGKSAWENVDSTQGKWYCYPSVRTV